MGDKIKGSAQRDVRASADVRRHAQQNITKKRGEERSSFASRMKARGKDRAGERARGESMRERAARADTQHEQAGRAQRVEGGRESNLRQDRREAEDATARHAPQPPGEERCKDPSRSDDVARSDKALASTADHDVTHPREEAVAEHDALSLDGTEQPAQAEAHKDVSSAGAASQLDEVQRVEQLAREIIEACQLGEGAMAKRVMMLEVSVPGRQGSVRIRLMRDGDGVNVRLRASDEGTRAMLSKHRGALREEGASRGVTFKRIEVV